MPNEIIVSGYREFLRACEAAPPMLRREIRATYREVGDIVKDDAKERMSELSRKSADGYRTYVRTRGVEVEQSLRKTTGLRPDWGKTQMRKALIPALDEKEPEVVAAFEAATADVVAEFNRTSGFAGLV
jgi:hypothetical protein